MGIKKVKQKRNIKALLLETTFYFIIKDIKMIFLDFSHFSYNPFSLDLCLLS